MSSLAIALALLGYVQDRPEAVCPSRSYMPTPEHSPRSSYSIFLSDPRRLYFKPAEFKKLRKQQLGHITLDLTGKGREVPTIDRRIALNIQDKLIDAHRAGELDGCGGFGIQVKEGTVWISGTVANELQHELLLDFSQGQYVREVVDNISVSPPRKRSSRPSIFAAPVRPQP